MSFLGITQTSKQVNQGSMITYCHGSSSGSSDCAITPLPCATGPSPSAGLNTMNIDPNFLCVVCGHVALLAVEQSPEWAKKGCHVLQYATMYHYVLHVLQFFPISPPTKGRRGSQPACLRFRLLLPSLRKLHLLRYCPLFPHHLRVPLHYTSPLCQKPKTSRNEPSMNPIII